MQPTSYPRLQHRLLHYTSGFSAGRPIEGERTVALPTWCHTFYPPFTSIGSKELAILSCVEDMAWRLLEAVVPLLELGNDVTLDEVKAYPNPACVC